MELFFEFYFCVELLLSNSETINEIRRYFYMIYTRSDLLMI